MHWSTSARSILRITNTGGSHRKRAHRDGIGPRCFGGHTFAAPCSSGSLHPAVWGSTGEACGERPLRARCAREDGPARTRTDHVRTRFHLGAPGSRLVTSDSDLSHREPRGTCVSGDRVGLDRRARWRERSTSNDATATLVAPTCREWVAIGRTEERITTAPRAGGWGEVR